MKALVIYFAANLSNTPNSFRRLVDILDDYSTEGTQCSVTKYNHFSGTKADRVKRFCPDEIKNSAWDVIVLHYSFLYQRTRAYDYPHFFSDFEWLADSPAVKIAMPQDEGNCAFNLDRMLFAWDIDYVFSVHYHSSPGVLYQRTQHIAKIYSCLPGYVDKKLLERSEQTADPISKRVIDVAYRGRPSKLQYGRASLMKANLPMELKEKLQDTGFVVDVSIAQEDRIYGEDWYRFLKGAKTTFASPGGYTAVDYLGEINSRVRYLEEVEELSDYESVSSNMPVNWDSYNLLTITPRHFECIACGTAQILVKHHYRDILVADKHYIPLEEDLSNIDQVKQSLRDIDRLQEMADLARQEILYHPSVQISSLLNDLDDCIRRGKPTVGEVDSALMAVRGEDELRYEKLQLAMIYNNEAVFSRHIKITREEVLFLIKRILVKAKPKLKTMLRRSYYLARRPVAQLAKILIGKRS